MGWWMNNQSRQALWLALAGSIVLMIGMGYGRFAFTGVLPLMLNEGLLTLHEGNLAASANYAGYLVGALLLARVQPGAATRLSIISAGLTIASLALLAGELAVDHYYAARRRRRAERDNADCRFAVAAGTYGASSRGAVAVCRGGAGDIYLRGGIALGHALSLTSQQIWLLCALCAGLLLALAIRWLLTPPAALVRASHVETSLPASGSDTRRAAWRLLMVYGLAGFGYIITATYLPLFLSGSLQSVDPVHLWALFGLAAAPSCLIWHKLVLKWGYRQALTRNLLFQALGVILPACSASLLFCVLSALLVGFTFMGTVTIALPKAKSLSHQVSFNMIAAMTALYGVGQIAGPLITGALYQIAASFNPALYAAALALLIAAGLVFTERQA